MAEYSSSSHNAKKPDFTTVEGVFHAPYRSFKDEDDGSDDSDSGDDDNAWTDFHVEAGDMAVRHCSIKDQRVEIMDDKGKKHVCRGRFPATHIFWRVRVKVNRGYLKHSPIYAIRRDEANVKKMKLVTIFFSECFRDLDRKNGDSGHATRACFETFCRLQNEDKTLSFTGLKEVLLRYINSESSSQGCFLARSPQPRQGKFLPENHSVYIVNHVLKSELGSTVLVADSYPQLVATLSELLPNSFMQVIYKLFGRNNYTGGPDETLEAADEMARERPWEFAFKDIIYTKLGIYGTEATLVGYRQAGYFSKTPQTVTDAMHIYDTLKTISKKDGHMYVAFRTLPHNFFFKKLNYFLNGEKRWQKALDYLEEHGVVKRENFDRDDNIFLTSYWKAETDITGAVDKLLKNRMSDPIRWNINFESPDFASIRKDPDQFQALHMITHCPVTVLSGRGGCGKTTVVTTLLKHLCDQEEERIRAERDSELEQDALISLSTGSAEKTLFDAETTCQASEDKSTASLPVSASLSSVNDFNSPESRFTGSGSEVREGGEDHILDRAKQKHNTNIEPGTSTSADISLDDRRMLPKSKLKEPIETVCQKRVVGDLIKIMEDSKEPDNLKVQNFKRAILLTAPTGKAARLLGRKAKLPSATLHSVIMSWKMFNKSQKQNESFEESWKYSKVQVLVVDECSLVSVQLFATIINILSHNSVLQKIVLLGDMQQLPSIDAGNFLNDMFTSFKKVAQDKFSPSIELSQNHRCESKLIVQNARLISQQVMPTFEEEQGFHLIDISDESELNEEIVKLLEKTDLECQVDSQFVSFRRNDCQNVNEICCKKYNNHSIMTCGQKSKTDFRIGDKICLGQNFIVQNNYELMIKKYRPDYPHFVTVYNQAIQNAEARFTGKDGKTFGEEPTHGSHKNLSQGRTLNADGVRGLTNEEDAEPDMTKGDGRLPSVSTKQQQVKSPGQTTQKLIERANMTKIQEDVFGGEKEKLCNGEVFFIMDEIDDFEGDAKKPVKFLILSDCDPELPRIVCVSAKVLRKQCKMRHSWARTIHTYQGSESNTVVFVVGNAKPQTWQHVYTAVTRGKKSVYIIGKWEELHRAISRRPHLRKSRLAHRMRENLANNAETIRICREDFVKTYERSQNRGFSGEMDLFTDSDDSWMCEEDSVQDALQSSELSMPKEANTKGMQSLEEGNNDLWAAKGQDQVGNSSHTSLPVSDSSHFLSSPEEVSSYRAETQKDFVKSCERGQSRNSPGVTDQFTDSNDSWMCEIDAQPDGMSESSHFLPPPGETSPYRTETEQDFVKSYDRGQNKSFSEAIDQFIDSNDSWVNEMDAQQDVSDFSHKLPSPTKALSFRAESELEKTPTKHQSSTAQSAHHSQTSQNSPMAVPAGSVTPKKILIDTPFQEKFTESVKLSSEVDSDDLHEERDSEFCAKRKSVRRKLQ